MHARVSYGSVFEYPIPDIRSRFPKAILPADLTNDAGLPEGYHYVWPTTIPVCELHQNVAEGVPQFVGGKLMQNWVVSDATPEEIAKRTADLAHNRREQAKAARDAAVAAIKVTTTAGNTFDGDETSQTRMTRAILALQATGTPTVQWVLADNTAIDATAAELTEALALAGAAQAAMWLIEDQP